MRKFVTGSAFSFHDTTTWPAPATADAAVSAVASPQTIGEPAPAPAEASVALPPEPPHPARNITAHAMTAPAAFPLPERELNAPKRLLRALIEGRASPGLCPIIVHVPSGYWVPDPSTTV
jgi:hypothetical protein